MTHGSPAMVLAKTHASQEEAVSHCSHLGIEEREDVMLLARQHKGVREIARTIGRDKPAVSRELARAWQIQERLGIPACFCAPRRPWEKGTNKNTNGLLRDFFPKGRSLDARPTRRRTQPMLCPTADRASASAGSARRRPSARKRCTCSENRQK